MTKKPETNITNYPNSIDTRVALLEMSISHINETLLRIEQDSKDFRKDVKSDFRWIIGLIIGLSSFTIAGFSGVLAVIAHGFHWI